MTWWTKRLTSSSTGCWVARELEGNGFQFFFHLLFSYYRQLVQKEIFTVVRKWFTSLEMDDIYNMWMKNYLFIQKSVHSSNFVISCTVKARISRQNILWKKIHQFLAKNHSKKTLTLTIKVKQPIVVKIRSLTLCGCWIFLFFSHNSISVRNNESNWNYVFLTKYEFAMNFWSIQCTHGPTKSVDYVITNKI